ncbi:nitroreductase family protein [Krasilnikovia sp. MM14-A1259]|uniref:nitroreductase family protein n=1 Tax=Krasilnikovia sp. MM14-A1259 TaxID=3373539 RepID=UPI00381291DE
MTVEINGEVAYREAARFPDHTQALRLLQKYSRLDADAATVGLRHANPSLYRAVDAHADAHHVVRAVAAASPATPLNGIQEQRLSIRYFDEHPVTVDVLAAITTAAAAFDQEAWTEQAAGTDLQVLVAARDVAGLPPAIYAHRPHTETFVRVGDLPTGDESADLVLQVEFADSPAIVLICGPLAASLDRHGEHGHRLLLSRAGAAAYAGWLTAIDHGLVGSIFAGFLATSLRPLAPVDGYYTTQLLALAVGHPRQRHRTP